MRKPSYCTNKTVDKCSECCYKNYGRDCMNNKIKDEDNGSNVDKKESERK